MYKNDLDEKVISTKDKDKTDLKCSLCNLLKSECNMALGVPICQVCWEMNANEFKNYKYSRTNFFPEIDQITEKVYLGNEDAQRDKENLKKIGVTHILVVGNGLDILHPLDFEYKKIEVNDFPHEEISKYFDETYEFIEKSNKVFVHCAAGISRSATIVIAYIMKKNKMSHLEAHQFVKEKRTGIYPNSGFLKQLENYKPNV